MRLLYYIFIGIVSIFFLSGCSSTKYLKEDEYILYRNTLKGAPREHSSKMKDLYKQKNNRKVLGGLVYVNIYNFGKLFYDTNRVIRKRERIIEKYDHKIAEAETRSERSRLAGKKEKKVERKNLTLREGSSFMRSFGEPPEIFDSSKVESTVYTMKAYLFSKGYFHNQVTSQIDTSRRKKRISVRYTIEADTPFVIKNINYIIKDDHRINTLINDPSVFTKNLKGGEVYDEDKLSEERENIYKMLKNQGYFDFQRQYITYSVDSLIPEPHALNIDLVIKENHKVFRVTKLFFNLNDVADKNHTVQDTTEYRNVHYTYFKKTYLRKLLDYKISTRPMDIYNQSLFQQTQRLLGSMDMYKFVNINLVENKEDTLSNSLTAYINTQPMNRFQISQEYGLSVGQALVPGPFLSLTLKTRNIARWLEVIENTLRYSLETQYSITSPDRPYRTSEFSVNTSISFAQLLLPTVMRDWLKNYNPRVKFFTGYTYVSRPEYRRESFKGALTYSFNRNIYSNIYVTPVDISFIDSRVDPTFSSFLQQLRDSSGSNLYLSFYPSIVTSFQVSYVYNNHEATSQKVTKFFRPLFEFGGVVPNFIAKTFGSEAEKDSNRLFGKQYFEYIRLGLDVRLYVPVRRKNTFVVRFNMGYAQPFGSSSRSNLYALPYEKYFFSGGNSSVRAWRPRRLGPGSYSSNAEDSYRYEQPGEILFETNYEYRFDIVSIFDGAFFVDAGNVWTIKNEKQGSQFQFPKVFNEIAVGAGFGLRLDFSFLVLRLDIANKVWDPAKPLEERFVGKFSLRNSVLNIGIGYPF